MVYKTEESTPEANLGFHQAVSKHAEKLGLIKLTNFKEKRWGLQYILLRNKQNVKLCH